MGAIVAIAVLLLVAKAAGGTSTPSPPPKPAPNPFADPTVPGGFTTKSPSGGLSLPQDTGGLIANPIVTKSANQGFKAVGNAASSLVTPGLTATIPPDPYAWPGIQSLPPAYRDPAMAAVQNLKYQWVIADEGPTANFDPCLNGGPCSSNAVYAALHPIYVDQAKINTQSGFGGANVEKALVELSHAYAKLKAVGR